MKKISFALILTFLLLACATPADYDRCLNKTLGDTEIQLVNKLGRPSAVKMFANGDKLLAYTKAENIYVPSEFYTYNQGAFSTAYDGPYSPLLGDYDFTPFETTFGYNVKYFCQTVFLIQNGVVTGWKWRGNNCVPE